MELREAALELQEENAELKTTLKDLEAKLNTKDHIEYLKSVYWLYKEDEGGDFTIKDGPYLSALLRFEPVANSITGY